MDEIIVEHKPQQQRLEEMGIYNWGQWSKEVSEFEWEYSEKETCFFIEGEVEVTPEGGSPVSMGKDDLVTFPKGMKCTWKITRGVRKYYKMG
jgi:uncharacterized cupin superfamily protein